MTILSPKDPNYRLITLANAKKRTQELGQKEECEENLYSFLQAGWKYIDPAEFKGGWHLEAIAEHLQAVTDGQIQRLVINVPPRSSKSSAISVAWPAWTWAQRSISPLAGPQVQFLFASYAQSLAFRDSIKMRRLIESPWYKKNWGDRFDLTEDQNTKGRFENNHGGYRLATSVGGALTGEGGSIIVCDDPHNAIEMESDLVRKSTIEWWSESLSTRLNDQETGAYVVIMQRLHQEDLTGYILSKEDGWIHVMIPMEHDPQRHCITYVKGKKFWEDPRTEENELLCPERFSRETVESLKSRMGPYACTPAESPVLMSDLTMRPISEIRVGDELVGFSTDTEKAVRRRTLVRTYVTRVFQYRASVATVTLDSGEVVRCTPDHQWYMGKHGGHRGWRPDGTEDFRPLYRPAKIGRPLMRVCPAGLPSLTREQERSAGWVAGFFDGEGSVSNCQNRHKRDHKGELYRPSISISFYQTSEKNLPMCERLEKELSSLGFDYGYFVPKKNKAPAHWQERRHYQLKGVNLPLCQKFLHVVGPTKWRQRIIDGAYGAKFISSQESVISIEPDGEEDVYALETTTGNYVVWGLASSNSAAQLDQIPVPRGGGIIKEEWWQHWVNPLDPTQAPSYPPCDYVLASLDTAYTEKEENDASALTILGVFRDENKNPKIMLIYGWQDRLTLNDLVQKVIDTCTLDKRQNTTAKFRFPVDCLLIESKASGLSVYQELVRTIGNQGKFGIKLYNPSKLGDKVARMYSIQHIFSEKMVYVPFVEASDPSQEDGYAWANEIIDQVSVFPRGSHDDYCDAISQGIRYLRDMNFALLREEHDMDVREEMMYRPRTSALYPV